MHTASQNLRLGLASSIASENIDSSCWCVFYKKRHQLGIENPRPSSTCCAPCNKFALRQSRPLLGPVTDKWIFPSPAEFSKRDAGPLSLTCSRNWIAFKAMLGFRKKLSTTEQMCWWKLRLLDQIILKADQLCTDTYDALVFSSPHCVDCTCTGSLL